MFIFHCLQFHLVSFTVRIQFQPIIPDLQYPQNISLVSCRFTSITALHPFSVTLSLVHTPHLQMHNLSHSSLLAAMGHECEPWEGISDRISLASGNCSLSQVLFEAVGCGNYSLRHPRFPSGRFYKYSQSIDLLVRAPLMSSESNENSPYNDYGNRDTFWGYTGPDSDADQGEYGDMSQAMGYGEQGEYEEDAYYSGGPEVRFPSLASGSPSSIDHPPLPPSPALSTYIPAPAYMFLSWMDTQTWVLEPQRCTRNGGYAQGQPTPSRDPPLPLPLIAIPISNIHKKRPHSTFPCHEQSSLLLLQVSHLHLLPLPNFFSTTTMSLIGGLILEVKSESAHYGDYSHQAGSSVEHSPDPDRHSVAGAQEPPPSSRASSSRDKGKSPRDKGKASSSSLQCTVCGKSGYTDNNSLKYVPQPALIQAP